MDNTESGSGNDWPEEWKRQLATAREEGQLPASEDQVNPPRPPHLFDHQSERPKSSGRPAPPRGPLPMGPAAGGLSAGLPDPETVQQVVNIARALTIDQISNGLWVLVTVAYVEGRAVVVRRLRRTPAKIERPEAEQAAQHRAHLAYPLAGKLWMEQITEADDGTWTVVMKGNLNGRLRAEVQVARLRTRIVARVVQQSWEFEKEDDGWEPPRPPRPYDDLDVPDFMK